MGGSILLVVKIWNYFRGYVLIRIEGLSLEKFINYAIGRSIFMWDLNRIDYTTMEAKVSIEGYKELRHIVKKAGCRVKIKVKIGYPFFMHKIKKRKIFMGSFVFAILSMILMTSFIWSIDIKGCESIDKVLIQEYIEKKGVKIGGWKHHIDTEKIEDNMLIDMNKLAWVGMEFKGTKLVVDIVEKVAPPARVEKNAPCNIIALKNGIIDKVIARDGDSLIEKGDIVKKGDILITGKIQREELPNRYVHARGDVYAKTYYENTDQLSLVNIEKIKTGNKKTKRTLKIGDSLIVLGSDQVKYKNVVIEKVHKTLPKWRNKSFPVEIIIEEYYEVKIKNIKLDRTFVEKALREKMLVEAYKKISKNAKVLNKNIVFTQEKSIIKGKLMIETLENISMEKSISKDEIIKEQQILED